MNEGLKSAKEYGDSWPEREKNIQEGLEKKLEFAKEFRKIIEGLRNGKLSKEKAEQLIKKMEDGLERGLPDDILAKYNKILEMSDRWKVLLKDTKEIEEREVSLGNYDFYDNPEFREKEHLMDELSEQMRAIIDQHPILDFVVTMKFALDHLQEALAAVEKYKKEPDLILRDLAKIRMVDYEELKAGLKIAQIIFTLTSVNIILQKGESWELLHGEMYNQEEYDSVVGLHSRGSFIHVIRNRGDEDINETIKHEDEHVITDAFDRQFLSLGPPAAEFSLAISHNDKNKLEDIISDKKGRYKAPRMLDDSHYEIITALTESKKLIRYLKSAQQKLFTEERLLRAILGENPELKRSKQPFFIPEIQEIIYLLHTAGFQIENMGSVLQKGEKSNDPKFSNICKQTRFRYVKIFLNSMGNLGYAYILADSFGAKAKKDVELLTYLLKPSQYHHIPKFLEHKYGKPAKKTP